MTRNSQEGPDLSTLLRKTLRTGLGALHNRSELFAIELQEEKARLIRLIICGIGALFLAMMTALLITGAAIFLAPEAYRLHVVGGFAVLYLVGTLWAVVSIKAMLRKVPFGDTLAEFKKDSELTEAFSE